MSVLGRNFRFRASNTHNQGVDVVLTGRLFKYTTTGIVWSTEQTFINRVGSSDRLAATTGTFASAPINNVDDKWEGVELTLACTAASATNGTGAVAITIERSTDAGTTWPTEGRGTPVGGAMALVAADGTTQRTMNLLVR